MSGIKVAVIGFGNMGTAHATCLAEGKIRGLELAAVCDIRPERLAESRRRFPGVACFADYRELINSDAVRFGGGGMVNEELLRPKPQGWNGQPFHISFRLPAGGAVIFQPIFPGQ